MTELKTSSLDDDVNNRVSEGDSNVHEEEQPWITFVGKQESRVRKCSN